MSCIVLSNANSYEKRTLPIGNRNVPLSLKHLTSFGLLDNIPPNKGVGIEVTLSSHEF